MSSVHIRTAGRSGLRVSALALGTHGWGTTIDAHVAVDLLTAFRDAGGTTLETAHGYGDGAAEETLGAQLTTQDRDELVLCAKSGLTRRAGGVVADPSRGVLLGQLDTTLSRLRTDHVDLWMVHAWNDQVPLEETLAALEYGVQTGRARYVGVSGYTGWQLARAATLAQTMGLPLVAAGTEYHLLDRTDEHELLPAAEHLAIGILAWAPLAGGVLTGKYRRGVAAQSRAASGRRVPHLAEGDGPVVEALVTAADGLGVTPAEVALAWVRERPTVASAVTAARTSTQLATLLRSTECTVPDEVVRALDEVSD